MLFVLECDGFIIILKSVYFKFFFSIFSSNMANINKDNLHKQKVLRGLNNF